MSIDEDSSDPPTVSCSRCERTWQLEFEREDLGIVDHVLEQFALDHERHTGHFPDDVTPWIVTCRRCPDGEQYLSEHPARRWAKVHARHTRHAVDLCDPEGDTSIIAQTD